MKERRMSKYWFVESENGLDGLMFDTPQDYNTALEYACDELGCDVYEVYVATYAELMLSELDIY